MFFFYITFSLVLVGLSYFLNKNNRGKTWTGIYVIKQNCWTK